MAVFHLTGSINVEAEVSAETEAEARAKFTSGLDGVELTVCSSGDAIGALSVDDICDGEDITSQKRHERNGG